MIRNASLFALRYYFGEDIHILRNGVPFELTPLFPAATSIAVSFGSNYTGVTSSTITPSPGVTETVLSRDGISLNVTRREISATTFANAVLHNMKIVVEATSGGVTKSFEILVHAHNLITDVWLTPDVLTLTKDNIQKKFGVYCQFDDNVIADLSNHLVGQTGYAWTLINDGVNRLALSSVSPFQGFITALSAAVSSATPFTGIEITLPNYLGNATATGQVIVADSYLSANSIHPVGSIGSNPSSDQNILIISDGYSDSEDAVFQTHVDNVVNEFRTGRMQSPWRHFKESINFWRLFLPSREMGGSLQGDYILLGNVASSTDAVFMRMAHFITLMDAVFDQMRNTQLSLTTVQGFFAPYPYLSSAINWSVFTSTTGFPANSSLLLLSELINKVGLPVQSEVNLPLTATPGPSRQSLWTSAISGWNSQNVNAFTYEIWKLLAFRTPLEFLDTSLNIVMGSFKHPAIKLGDPGMENLTISPILWRSKLFFNRMINSLQHNSVNVGGYFFDTNGTVTGNATSGENIIVLSNIPVGTVMGEHQLSDPDASYIVTTTNVTAASIEVICELTGGVYKPRRRSMLTRLGIHETGTAIHEFSHNFLLDEYGTVDGAAIPSSGTSEINTKNLQLHSTLIASGTNNVEGHRIRWLWPRVEKICVLETSLTGNGPYAVTVGKLPRVNGPVVPSPLFTEDEFVILRKKDLYENHLYPVFKITTISGNTFTIAYQGKNATFEGGASIPIPSFAAGDYLANETYIIKPIWADNVGEKFISLVHPSVINLITSQHNAIVQDDPLPTHDIQFPDTAFASSPNWPAAPQPFLVTGLYAAGNGFRNGIYHPSGFCMMRNINVGLARDNVTILDPDAATPFTRHTNYYCPVCKYILIDKIDATKHPAIDAEYATIYPH